MDPALTRRLWLTLGGGAAVLAIALAAAFFILLHGHKDTTPPPASTGGLVVQTQVAAGTTIDPQKPLRCFVNGQFVGQATLADCAQRNGVATDALDVGVDQTGELAAADQSSAAVTPLPPAAESPAPASSAPAEQAASTEPQGDCLRYVGNQWRKAGAGMSLPGCVKLLFAGYCQKTGASYGRWMAATLRLMPGAVEISNDNKNFRPLVEQSATCDIPDFQEPRP